MDPNYHVILKSRPGVNGEPSADNFEYSSCPSPSDVLETNNILIKTCYLSVDPAQRCQMNEDPGVHYLTAWGIGETVTGLGGVGVIIKSNHAQYQPGDLIQGALYWPWRLYFTVNPDYLKYSLPKVDKAFVGNKPSLAISLGLVGVTALLGIREKGHISPDKNQTLVVSGAAGACGSLAGQIGKLDGCKKVVGICGSDEKCDVLTKELGFDYAINYKTKDVDAELKQACPDGIDEYFDNVGGEISNTVIKQMNKDSHVILCGQIAVYNRDLPYPPPIEPNITQILTENNITRERYLVLNYPDKFPGAYKQLAEWYYTSKLKVKETVAEGLSQAGVAFASMMKGGNIGKQIVHVSDP